ncbi:MAG TPA: hypothetical protein VIS06_00450 [Mycobacteriales bacterium]
MNQPEHDAILARLPHQFGDLRAAAQEAGWRCTWSITDQFEFGQVIREIVNLDARYLPRDIRQEVTHMVSASFLADAPPDTPRPRFRCGTALVRRDGRWQDVSMRQAVAYIQQSETGQ